MRGSVIICTFIGTVYRPALTKRPSLCKGAGKGHPSDQGLLTIEEKCVSYVSEHLSTMYPDKTFDPAIHLLTKKKMDARVKPAHDLIESSST
jgi:hypothetical protein